MPSTIPWLNILDCHPKSGDPRPNLSNAVMVLQHDPQFSPDRLWYDSFLDTIFIKNSEPRAWRDDDAYGITVYMQDVVKIHAIPDQLIAKAVVLVAKQRTTNVVMEWLSLLEWDQQPRIEQAFSTYWGADDSEYTRAASKNFFVGMVARIFNPGCKLDTMPVFEGKQGIRKSSALSVLGGDWYGITHERAGTKDFLQGLRGKWLLEIAELQSFSKSDIRAVKNTLSTEDDDYRPSYGRTVVRFPRQSVFAGTTNVDDWGTDETGLRRFWPITCGTIDIVRLARDREQLFAEAARLLVDETTWWEMPATTEAVQHARQQGDVWADYVLPWCALKIAAGDEYIRITDVLREALKIDPNKMTRADEMRVAKILKVSRWEKRDFWISKKNIRGWVPEVSSAGGVEEGVEEF